MAWLGENQEELSELEGIPRTTKDQMEEQLFDRRRDPFREVTLAFQGKKFLMRSELTGHARQAVRTAGVALPPPMREAPPDDL